MNLCICNHYSYESYMKGAEYSHWYANDMQVLKNFSGAVKGMVRTIKYPVVWKPSLYMFLSLSLSISTHEGQFYWYTNKTPPNPGFSQVKYFLLPP